MVDLTWRSDSSSLPIGGSAGTSPWLPSFRQGLPISLMSRIREWIPGRGEAQLDQSETPFRGTAGLALPRGIT